MTKCNQKPVSETMNWVVLCWLFLLQFAKVGRSNGRDECRALTCSEDGPEIRFPFRLLQRHPQHCGYPGFEISCTTNNMTFLELMPTVKMQVSTIDYKSQSIDLEDKGGCSVKQIPVLNMSVSPFRFVGDPSFYIFLNCSAADRDEDFIDQIPCLSSSEYKVYAVTPETSLKYLPLSSCTRMDFPNPSVASDINNQVVYYSLNWSYPSCKKCEEQGKKCRVEGGVERETECYPAKGAHELNTPVATGVTVGSVLLVVAALTLRHLRGLKRTEGEIKRFLEDYKSLKPTRYSYNHIKRITNGFKNKLGQGGYGSVFKGNLSREIFVAVKMLDKIKGNGEDFINEVATIGRIHHVNVVRLVGYCADGAKRALVYEYLPNGSLDKFINQRNNGDHNLSLEKLQNIAVSIARGIEYLHQGCEKRILHFDIKPNNILLDEEFNPKVSDFGLAKLWSREKSAVSMTLARGTPGYIAPEVFSRNFGNVTVKSDVYSFGMLLLDMVGVRKNDNVAAQSASQKYFPDWIYDCINEGEDQESWIQESGNVEVAKKLVITGLWCTQWYPVDRPSMKSVIQMLEGNIDDLCMPPKPCPSDDPFDIHMTTHAESWSTEHVDSYVSIESESNVSRSN